MKYSVLLLIAVLTSGCVTAQDRIEVNLYNTAQFTPTSVTNINVFRQNPPGDFLEMGEITIYNAPSIEYAQNALKIKAAALGGDAIRIIGIDVIQEPQEYHGYESDYGSPYHRGARRRTPYYNQAYREFPVVQKWTETDITATAIVLKKMRKGSPVL